MLEEDLLMYCHSCPQFMLIIMSYKWEIILPSSLPACAKSYLRIDYFAMSCRSTFITVFHSSCEVPVQATADQTAPRPPRRRGELRLKLFDCHINVISSIVKRQMLLCFMHFYRARFCNSSQYCAPQFFSLAFSSSAASNICILKHCFWAVSVAMHMLSQLVFPVFRTHQRSQQTMTENSE